MYKHILLPIDGSKLSLKAVKTGVALARALSAKVTVFYASPGIAVEYYASDMPMPQEVFDAEAARLKKEAQKVLATASAVAVKAGVPVQSVSVQDRMAAEAIMDVARKRRCDLIVMSSHGRSGIGAVLLGSVTNKVLTHSRTPVLVCRA